MVLPRERGDGEGIPLMPVDESDFAKRFEFRARGPHEKPDAYRRKLIAHVSDRDLAAGHELRVDRLQADWTREDVESFTQRHTTDLRMPREDVRGDVILIPDDGTRTEPTDAALLAICDRNLSAMLAMRAADPRRDIRILASVLLMNGQTISAVVADRSDRVAVIKQMARHLPVFGYVLVADCFIHSVDTSRGVATKTDAFIAHVGTRELRLTRVRPYHVDASGTVVVDPPREDITPASDWKVAHDPYAAIFVSVPASTGAPS